MIWERIVPVATSPAPWEYDMSDSFGISDTTQAPHDQCYAGEVDRRVERCLHHGKICPGLREL